MIRARTAPAEAQPEKRLVRHVGFRLACALVETGRGLLVLPLIARALGPHDFGHLALAIAIWMLLHALTVSPFNEIVVRECARDPQAEPAILSAAVRLQSWLAAASLPVAFALGAAAGVETGLVALVLSCSLFFNAVAAQSLALMVRLRGEWLTLARLIGDALFVAGVALAYVAGAGMLVFALLYLGNTALVALLSAGFARRYAVPRRGAFSPLRLLRLSAPMMGGSLTSAANRELGVILLAAVGGAAVAGVYAAANRFVRVGLILPAAIGSSLMAVLPRLAGRELSARVRKTLLICAGLGVAAALGFALAAPFAAALLGEGYRESAAILPVLGLVVALSFLALPLVTVVVADGRASLAAWSELLALAVNGAGVLIGSARWGVVGAAWAAVAAVAAQCLLLALAARRRRATATPLVAGEAAEHA